MTPALVRALFVHGRDWRTAPMIPSIYIRRWHSRRQPI
jgi:hypothetical protein